MTLRTLEAVVQQNPLPSSTWSSLFSSPSTKNQVTKSPSVIQFAHVTQLSKNKNPSLLLGFQQETQLWEWESCSKLKEIWSLDLKSLGSLVDAQVLPSLSSGTQDSTKPHVALLLKVNETSSLRIQSLNDPKFLRERDLGSGQPLKLTCSSDFVCILFETLVLVFDTASYESQPALTDVKYAIQQPWLLWSHYGKWVAYAMDVPPEKENGSLFEEASKLAGKVMDKVKEYGMEKYDSCFSSSDKPIPKEPLKKFLKGKEDGWVKKPCTISNAKRLTPQVIVRNLSKNGDCVSYWRPHNQPLNHIQFTNSGTKLITTPIGANSFHIWDLTTGLNPSCVQVCQRGYTSAIVLDMSLSVNDSWLAVTTNHGTTHLFQCTGKRKMSASLRIRRGEQDGWANNSNILTSVLKIKHSPLLHIASLDCVGNPVVHSIHVSSSSDPVVQSISIWDLGVPSSPADHKSSSQSISAPSKASPGPEIPNPNLRDWHTHLDAVSYPDTTRPIWCNPMVSFELYNSQGQLKEYKEGQPDFSDLPDTLSVNMYTSLAPPNGFSSTSTRFPAFNTPHKQVEEALSGALQSNMDTESKEVIAPRLDKRRDDLPFDDEWTVQLDKREFEDQEEAQYCN